ncbi:hypothetical protein [Roseomonas indoligenes]|uniref:Argininosuccinate lyase n=1 Tax=Roseomonas indoligenes TaxID=2820811 RepID=A0A940MWW7_9PROT|nr:hypothetical protein [Pararoseomonas indoligenes]MBP0493178.1 hypothetical protein [Pararoseomonas indoligenes]
MNCRILPTLGLALALGVPAAVQAQTQLDFSLVNRTGAQIDEVHLSPVSSNSWGSDVMGQDALADGGSVDIQFNRGANTCNWDLKVVYNDGDQAEWRGLDLCRISRVTLFWDRQANSTRAVTE